MGIAVTTLARGKFCIGKAMQCRRPVHTLGMFKQRVVVTSSAVHRIESAPVPPLPTDVAIQTCRVAVWGALEESQIYFMTVVTLVGLLGVGHLRNERQAENHQGEEFAHCSHHGSS
jgi:D-arabinose 1-dehydrogenase-like Zn-dependent alcohol dehydrogenase